MTACILKILPSRRSTANVSHHSSRWHGWIRWSHTLATLARRLVLARATELRVSDAEEFGECVCGFWGEIAIGAQVGFDDLRSGLVRIVNDRGRLVAFRVAAAEHTFHRHVEPRCEARDVVSVRFAGTVFDSRQSRCRDAGLVCNVTQTQAQLLATPAYRSSQLFCVDQCLCRSSHKLYL